MKKNENENLFYHYFHQEMEAVQKTFTSSIPSQPRHIHRLRIHIKTIRTLLLLFDETTSGQLKIKKFRTFFRNVFKAAGKVREMQLNHLLAKQSDATAQEIAVYGKHAHKKKHTAKKHLQKIFSLFDPTLTQKADRKVKTLCKTLSDYVILLQSKQFILEKIKQVQSIPEKSGNEGLHRLRKYLKSIYAVAFIVCKIHPTEAMKKQLKQLKKTEQTIGEWHDNLMFQVSWTHFQRNGKQAPNQKMTVSQHLLQIKTGNRKSIHTLLQHILNNLP
ncbi:MAG: hypothetical protein JWO58_1602 [Chitinophagaceae bacterium]|nr:hypothetical protein [Chitinophagaceae bacterium]